MKMRQWFLNDGDRLVRIKSMWPVVFFRPFEFLWPTMLISSRGCGRMTVQPVWNWPRLKAPFVSAETKHVDKVYPM